MRIDSSLLRSITPKTIMKPERIEEGWWAGAPSVLYDEEHNLFYLAVRMRHTLSPRGRRGYKIIVLESKDGVHFRNIFEMTREETPLKGFERPALVKDPESGKIVLYGCGEFPDKGWGIWRLDPASSPSEFKKETLIPVLLPEHPASEVKAAAPHHAMISIQYKDPFIIFIEKEWNMFVIGFDRVERPYRFTSKDGIQWSRVSSSPLLESTGWHNFFTRPASLLPLSLGYLFIYEGSSLHWYDPTYNIATGLAYTPDLVHYFDLTSQSPLIKSATPYNSYHTWRYSHWIIVKDILYIYYETITQEGINETQLLQIPIDKR